MKLDNKDIAIAKEMANALRKSGKDELLVVAGSLLDALLKEREAAEKAEPITDEMVLAAARALNKHEALTFNVDIEDQWAIYADDFKKAARLALDAARGIKE